MFANTGLKGQTSYHCLEKMYEEITNVVYTVSWEGMKYEKHFLPCLKKL